MVFLNLVVVSVVIIVLVCVLLLGVLSIMVFGLFFIIWVVMVFILDVGVSVMLLMRFFLWDVRVLLRVEMIDCLILFELVIRVILNCFWEGRRVLSVIFCSVVEGMVWKNILFVLSVLS